MMYSVVELSGAERCCFIERTLYSYRPDQLNETHSSVDYFRKQSLLKLAFNQPSKEPILKPPGVCCGSVLCVAEDIMTQWEVAETKLDRNWIRAVERPMCESSTNFNVLILPNNGTVSSIQDKISSALMQSERARVYLFPHSTRFATKEFLKLFCATRQMQDQNYDVMYAVNCLKSEALGHSKSDYAGIKKLRARLSPNDVIVVLAGENHFHSQYELQNADEIYRNGGYLAKEHQEPIKGIPLLSFRAFLWDSVTSYASLAQSAEELRSFLTFPAAEIHARENRSKDNDEESTSSMQQNMDGNASIGVPVVNESKLGTNDSLIEAIPPLRMDSISIPFGVCCARTMCNQSSEATPPDPYMLQDTKRSIELRTTLGPLPGRLRCKIYNETYYTCLLMTASEISSIL